MVNFVFLLGLLATVQATVNNVDPKTIETRSYGALFLELYKPSHPSTSQFEEIAKLYSSPSIAFAKINCEDYANYCAEKEVTQFPQVLTSLHRGAWKKQKGALEDFVKVNMPFRNLEGKSESIENQETMDRVLSSKDPWFIKFYAPWCGHCKNLAPEWVQVASRLRDKVNVGEVDCSKHKALCKDVTGLPTLKYFVHGQELTYNGERKADELTEYALEYSNTAVRGVRSDEALDKLLPKFDVNLVYVTEKEKPALEALEAIAPEYLSTLPFYTTQDPNTAERLELNSIPAIAILKDEQVFIYDEKEDLRAWIQRHSKPSVYTVLPHNANTLLRQSSGTILLGIFSPEDVNSLNLFRQTAPLHSEYKFVYLEAWKYAIYASRVYGVNTVHLPAVVIVQPKEQQYFKHDLQGKPLTIKQPETLFEALTHLDQLTPISTAPSKSISYAGRVFAFIEEYWVLWTSGLFVLLVILTYFIATTGTETPHKPELKKE
ncbi:hypothetical protein BY458DRAFT_556652 [Sporodiniella umbellata]|nr:hypothetical protein BY458DRAFT_556652 [Sporodiniella umbellata]